MSLSLGEIRYNARNSAFEARVDIEKNGVTYRYPCSVEAPLTTEPTLIREALARQACRQSGVGASIMSVI